MFLTEQNEHLLTRCSMSEIALSIENVSKIYRLGLVGTDTLSDDLVRWWHKVRGKEDPFLQVGAENDRGAAGGSDYVWALQNLNIEIKQGEIVGLIGKNGAGKSTLLKLLSQVTAPTQGNIRVKGRLSSLLEVGTGFHQELTGRENIYLNGAILGMRKEEITSKLEEIVDFSGVAKYIDTPVKRYSSGMLVRLGFAVAAHLEPDILVVDEVLAVGDAEFQKKAIGKMKEVSRTGSRTVLFVSHNMGSIRTLCQRGIVLENGMLAFDGSAEDAVQNYLAQQRPEVVDILAHRTDRMGNGKLKFVDIEVINESGKVVNEVVSGDPVQVKLSYEVNGPIDPQKLNVALTFWGQNQNRVLGFSSDEMNRQFGDLKDSGVIILEIPELMLRGGQYSIKLVASEGGTKMEDMLDNIANVCDLTVLAGDLWKVGRPNRQAEMALCHGVFHHER